MAVLGPVLAHAVRDLLANRSGLRCAPGWSSASTAEGTKTTARSRLVADAAAGVDGQLLVYTNAGWCVLGRVIETSAGAAWRTPCGATFSAG
jgi:CubicO group peptidase (beta-lactamase class C family)